MSTSPPRARAVARVRPADNAPVGEARLVRRRRPGYLGPLHLLQLLLLEAVVLGILVAVKSGAVIVAGAAVVAGVRPTRSVLWHGRRSWDPARSRPPAARAAGQHRRPAERRGSRRRAGPARAAGRRRHAAAPGDQRPAWYRALRPDPRR